MKNTQLRVILAAFVTIFIFLNTIGCCTLIGYSIGGKIDKAQENEIIASLGKSEEKKPGPPLVVILKNEEKIRGKYIGTALLSQGKYNEVYSQYQKLNQEKMLLPCLEERIEIMDKFGNVVKGEFVGFEFLNMMLIKSGKRTGYLGHRLSDISRMKNSENKSMNHKTIRNLVAEGKIPSMSSGILLQTNLRKREISWNEVSQIKFSSGLRKLIGALIGGAIDVALVIAAMNALAEAFSNFLSW